MKSRRAFSLLEVLIASVIMAVALLGLLWMGRHSTAASMDAYYEGLALSLAREPIEVLQGMGFGWVEEYRKGNVNLSGHAVLETCPYDEWFQIGKAQAGFYPAEAGDFKRFIAVDGPLEDGGGRAWRVKVSIAPVSQTRVDTWLSRNEMTLEGLVLEKLP